MATRKTWREKLERNVEAKIVDAPSAMRERLGARTLLIPRPLDVDALIRKVPKGRLLTISEIRSTLALEAGADTTCPLVTGIFIRLSAEVAAEEERAGKTRIAPYWRVVRDDGSCIDKLPGGPAEQSRRLRAEGHHVVPKGRSFRVIAGTAGTMRTKVSTPRPLSRPSSR